MEKENATPLVSVCCTCYNHGKYIRNTLEGFLMQKTRFSFEIIVFDDASTDNSQQIILEYATKHPDLFRLFLQKENLWQNKKISGTFTVSFPNASGKYIAWCEGDDYWTDPLKLQKQVDFLEQNPDFSICFHQVQLLRENNLLNDYITLDVPDVTDIYYLAKGNYIHTPSVVFRKNSEVFDTLTLTDMRHSTVGDYLLHMLNAQYGKIKKLPDRMAVYRLNSGFWSNMDIVTKTKKTFEYLDLLIAYFQDSKILEILIKSRIKFFKRFVNGEFMSDKENVRYFREAVRYFRHFIDNLKPLQSHRVMLFKLKMRLLRISMRFEFKLMKDGCRNIEKCQDKSKKTQ
jgi:glycosyltransferase involved in cell wall biosynthesis